MKNKKRVGFVLACLGMIAALLFEPINGPKRRDRLGHALEPAGRPLRAVRERLSGKAGEESGEGSGATLIDRLHHVALRAQGKIDMPDDGLQAELKTYTDGGVIPANGARPTGEPKPPRRRKEVGSAE